MVYKGLHKTKGNFVAIKQLVLPRHSVKGQLDSLMMEIDLLKTLQHHNIVKYIDHVATATHLNIILEYIENGSLAGLIQKYGKFPESLVMAYAVQILEGLSYLHEQGVIHRDIKSANILVGTDGSAKLADFGVAIHKLLITNDDPSTQFVGSPYWMAPEIITLSGRSTPACDIWSLGCTLIELLTGKAPYMHLQPAAALYHIVSDVHPPLPENCISDELRNFLLLCFEKDPSKRISANSLLKHPWLQSARTYTIEPAKASLSEVRHAIEVYNDALKEIEADFSSSAYTRFRTYPSTLSKSKSDTHLARVLQKANVLETSKREPVKTLGSDKASEQSPAPAVSLEDNEKQQTPQTSSSASNLTTLSEAATAVVGGDEKEEFHISNQKLQRLSGTLNSLTGIGPLILKEKYNEWLLCEVLDLISKAAQPNDPRSVIQACQRLGELFRFNPEERSKMMEASNEKYGIETLLSLLENSTDTQLILAILTAINNMAVDDKEVQINFCIYGGALAVIRFADPKFPLDVRIQAARFLAQLCTNPTTLQMLIGCRGLPVILSMFSSKYEEAKQLVEIAISSILSILKLSTVSLKYDFCGVFAKMGLLERLAETMVSLRASNKDSFSSLVNIMLHFSQSGNYVRKILGEQTLTGIKLVLMELKPGLTAAKLLKIVNTLSQDPDFKDRLEEMGFIEEMVNFLEKKIKKHKKQTRKKSYVLEVQIQALQSLVNLCLINKRRQERVINAGVLPVLKTFLVSGSLSNQISKGGSTITQGSSTPTRELAFELLSDMPHASIFCRSQIWDQSLYEVYISCLSDSELFAKALSAVTAWLPFEEEMAQRVFVSDHFITKLADVFSFAKNSETFSKGLDPFLKIVTECIQVNKSLVLNTDLIPKLLDSLQIVSPLDRLTILKILVALCYNSLNPKQLVDKYNLFVVVQRYENDPSLLVRNVVRKLLDWLTLVQFTPEIGFLG